MTGGEEQASPEQAPRLILASASPRRTRLLEDWGIAHEIVVPDFDETFEPGLDPVRQAERLARAKAEFVLESRAEARAVLGADTIVAVADRQLAKPADAAEALAMLLDLSGREIRVVTGVALARRSAETLWGAETTLLDMRAYDLDEARSYVATGEPLGKAGAFAIQGEGGRLIASRRGSYSNVVGLPRRLVLDLLRRGGLLDGEL